MDLLLSGKRAVVLGGAHPVADAVRRELAAEGAALLGDAEEAGGADIVVRVAVCGDEPPGGYLVFLRRTAEAMAARGWGRIVSVALPCADPAEAEAHAGALSGATLAAARAALGADVTVNAVFTADADSRANALGRAVSAEEVAGLAAFLCSPLALTVTGESLAATGGASAAVSY